MAVGGDNIGWYIAMKIIVGCEMSGIVRDAFAVLGHESYSCDLLPPESMEGPHIQDDILKLLAGEPVTLYGWPEKITFPVGCWDLGIFHPPCTFMCNSGVRWLKYGTERWAHMIHSVAFFQALLDAPIPRICIENPVMHGHAAKRLSEKYSQTLQPWQYGDRAVKRTCLWLKNLPALVPTDIVGPPRTDAEKKEFAKVHLHPPGPERAKNRSRTYVGIARAFAAQWGI